MFNAAKPAMSLVFFMSTPPNTSPIYEISTILIAFAALILAVINTWNLLARDMVRMRITSNPESKIYDYKFEVVNLSLLSITVSRVVISLCRSKKKAMQSILWERPQIMESTTITVGGRPQEAKVHRTFPKDMRPRSNMEVYFNTASIEFQAEEVNLLHQSKHGYMFVRTACGKIFRKKFTVPPISSNSAM